jgi:hypothetical protein
MKLYLFILIEILFMMLISVLIYNAQTNKNLKLSLQLNKIILIIGFIKIAYLTYSIKRDMSVCDISKELYC